MPLSLPYRDERGVAYHDCVEKRELRERLLRVSLSDPPDLIVCVRACVRACVRVWQIFGSRGDNWLLTFEVLSAPVLLVCVLSPRSRQRAARVLYK